MHLLRTLAMVASYCNHSQCFLLDFYASPRGLTFGKFGLWVGCGKPTAPVLCSKMHGLLGNLWEGLYGHRWVLLNVSNIAYTCIMMGQGVGGRSGMLWGVRSGCRVALRLHGLSADALRILGNLWAGV